MIFANTELFSCILCHRFETPDEIGVAEKFQNCGEQPDVGEKPDVEAVGLCVLFQLPEALDRVGGSPDVDGVIESWRYSAADLAIGVLCTSAPLLAPRRRRRLIIVRSDRPSSSVTPI
jgi:hypothetical protein